MGLILVVATMVNCGGGGSTSQVPADGGMDRGESDGAMEARPEVPDTLFSGRRSFLVTSTLSATGSGATVSPTSHVFTMVIDGDRKTAISGANLTARANPFQSTPGGFRFADLPLFLQVTGGACPPMVRYSDLTFTVDSAGRLSGSGSGQLMTNERGTRANVDITMALAGVPDVVPPTVTLVVLGSSDLTDPFSFHTALSSEPLPRSPSPVLRAAGGDVAAFSSASADEFALSFGAQPPFLLRYGEQYQVDISGIRDFAGNDAVGAPEGLSFTTRPPPPLVAPDGFESVTDATLGGAQLLSAAGDPIISGTRSLYVPPPALGSTVQLTLRLAITPGASTLRFAYRSVNGGSNFLYMMEYASVGGGRWSADLGPGVGAMAAGVIGGTQVTLGPVTAVTIPLPGRLGRDRHQSHLHEPVQRMRGARTASIPGHHHRRLARRIGPPGSLGDARVISLPQP